MAEREGFEPSVAVRATHDFQSCTFGHSVISPLVSQLKLNPSAVFDDAFGRPLMGLAERVGFEPTVTLQPQRFSRPPLSTTQAPLHKYSVIALPCTTACGRPSQVGEKPPQEFSAFLSHDARRHFAAMVQPGILHQIAEGAAGACFWIESSEYQARQSGKYDRPGTHAARLEGHIQCAVVEPPTVE